MAELQAREVARSGSVAPLVAADLHKRYQGAADDELHILRGVDLRLEQGEAVAIVGTSGAGKSTLLHLLGALDRPSSGDVRLAGESVAELGDVDLARLRNRHVGFVFQFHHLLREFSALENVMLPMLIDGCDRGHAAKRARALLDEVGLSHREGHRATELSGGEQQRVAVARALANDPAVLLADEPSGNLDTRTSVQLHDTLFGIREHRAFSMVLVTHNDELARRADRVLRLRNGRLEALVGPDVLDPARRPSVHSEVTEPVEGADEV